jgi:hypothetical protein
MLTKVNDDEDFINNFWMSDEAHFHLNCFVNKKNFRYWAGQNPRQQHERQLHRSKVTVWCIVSSSGLIGPYFIENDGGLTTTVKSVRYAGMLEKFVAHELHNFPEQIDNTRFQQDGATAHTARISMVVVRRLFDNRVISRDGDGTWPPRSPDLTACNLFLWCHLKN